MRRLHTCIMLVGALSIPAFAADITNVNPTGAMSGVVARNVVLPTADPLCGALDYDGTNGLAAGRRADGSLDSWELAPCDFSGSVAVGGMMWLGIDNTDGDWNGTDDWAIWDAATVEGGCADDSNIIAGAWNVANTREPLMDDNGNQVVLFGRNAWIYALEFATVNLNAGSYYFAPRVVLNGGQEFILTRACNGDKQGWFQSGTFGFPCAVPNEAIFGQPYCAAIAPMGEGAPPEPVCLYMVKKVRMKTGICGEPCESCPFAMGDVICTVPCDPDAPQCDRFLKGFNACAEGGVCHVKARGIGCDVPPDDCTGCK